MIQRSAVRLLLSTHQSTHQLNLWQLPKLDKVGQLGGLAYLSFGELLFAIHALPQR
jgi:hypothetical protein